MAAPYQNYDKSTFLSDLVTRPEFIQYVSEDIFFRCQFVQSGVISRNSALDTRAGGVRLQAPHYQPLNPVEEIIESNATWGCSGAGYLTPQKIQADSSIMTILHRGMAFGADDLSKLGTGSDPLNAIKGYLGKAISRLRSRTLISMLEGVFGTALACNAIDASGESGDAAYLNATNVLKVRAALGERGESLTAIAMHSACYYYLVGIGALTFSSSSLNDGNAVQWGGGGINVGQGQATVSSFMGMRVIVDDLLAPDSDGKYPVYLFGDGAVQEGVQQELRTEEDRNILSLQDVLSVSYHYGFHIPGVSWKNAADNPANDDVSKDGSVVKPGLSQKNNWELTFEEPALIPIAKLTVKTNFTPTSGCEIEDTVPSCP